MRVREIMTSPAVCIDPAMPLKRVASLFLERKISAVPVIDEKGDLIGILSEQDLLPLQDALDPRRHVMETDDWKAPLPRTAGEIMTRNVISLPENADVGEAARIMIKWKVKRVPVVSGRRVVGIVSRRDLLGVLARSDEDILSHLEEVLDREKEVLGTWKVGVRDGVVKLMGDRKDPSHRLAALVARSIPGVVSVTFAGSTLSRR